MERIESNASCSAATKTRRRQDCCVVLAGLLLPFHLSLCVAADEARESFFETNIRPVLIERCFECHGKGDVESGLRVDSRQGLLSGGDRGPAVRPGDADGSLLIQALRHTHELKMPPQSPLPPRQLADFARWINAGAAWPEFAPVKIRRTGPTKTTQPTPPDESSLKQALQAWYRADGKPWQDGQPVHVWEDDSGRGHDLVATAGARLEGTGRPATFVTHSNIAGYPAVRFSMDSGLGGNGATAPDIERDAEFTMLLVTSVAHVPADTDGLIAGFGEPAHPANPGRARCAILGIASRNNGHPVFVGGWGNDAAPPLAVEQPLINGRPVIITLTKQRGPLAATSEFHINGIRLGLVGHGETPDFGRRRDLGFFMGHARSWLRGFVGDVAEVVLYRRAITQEERHAVETYLSGRYRIPLQSRTEDETIAVGDPAFHSRHWAFEPIAAHNPPSDDAEHPIDRFIESAWKMHGVKPVAQTDARTLIRRLYVDLIGLPPSADEMQSAIGTLTPWSHAAWAGLIDRLLASPRYGERWGRHWLDVARYADTAGDNADYPIPEASLYRDYVIDAFNNDKPFDQFVREQIAGDILAAEGPRERYAEQVTATGFLALSRRYATGPYELWHLTLEDTIDTVGQAFLGVTLRCARCHDHKFDPISQRDYYALYGIFESTQYPWAGAEEFHSQKRPRQHFVSLLPPNEAEPLLTAFRSAAAATDQADEKLKADLDASKLRGFPLDVPSAYAVREGTVRHAVLQQSGDPGKPGAVVPRGVPSFLDQIPQADIRVDQSGRRQLAEWLTHPDHPLTARVMVNRIWQHHFGRGIVATPSNFGTRGSPPSHPELLDWLARSFVENGWSIKRLHRLILTSQVWRLASDDDAGNATIDPGNELLWKHTRRRLDAEAIRDSFLAISGRLDVNRPGPHPFPPITNWQYTQHNQFRDFYPSMHRSVYLMTTRLQRHPFLALFDGPDTNTTTDQRRSSIVSSQSLYLMNSDEVRTHAEAFASRVIGAVPEARIELAYALAFQRQPTTGETAKAEQFLEQYTQRSDERSAWTALCRSLLISHEAFHLD